MKNKYSKKQNYRLWNVYHSMKKRCSNANSTRYKDYGGRGITVCDEWLQGFDAFAEWALSNGYDKNLTIERIDNDGNYSPQNCTWTSNTRQSYNKRTTIMVEYNGENKCLMEWCNVLSLPYDATHHRITNGWDVALAFETPIKDNSVSLSSKCKARGTKYSTVRDRIKKLGWDEKRALTTPTKGLGANGLTYELQG